MPTATQKQTTTEEQETQTTETPESESGGAESMFIDAHEETEADDEQNETSSEDQEDDSHSSELIERARELGLEVDENARESDIAAAALQKMRELSPYAQYGQAVMPYASQIEEYLRSGGGQAQQRQEPSKPKDEWNDEEYFSKLWNAPQWREEYTQAINKGIVRRDPQTGMYMAAEGFETLAAPLLSGLNQALEYASRQWQSIVHDNPYKLFYEKLREPLSRQWKQDVQQLLRQELEKLRLQQEVESYESRNANWLYKSDGKGGTVPTEQGKKFFDAVEMLRNSGVTDVRKMIEIAERIAGVGATTASAAAATTQTTGAATQTKEKKKSSFLNDAMRRAQYRPQSGAAMNPADDPGHLSEGEVNNLFVAQYRASTAKH